MREIARVLGRSASTISRELRRNAAGEPYASAAGCQRRRTQARPPRKLHADSMLFEVIRRLLQRRWSPEQIALVMAKIYPKGHQHRVSHETIYNCIYASTIT